MKRKKTVDLYKVFKKKKPLLAIFLRFTGILFLLRKVVHETDINKIFEAVGHFTGIAFAKAALAYLRVKIVVHPRSAEIPAEGRYLCAANHPLGGLEALGLMQIFGEKKKKIKFLANDILMAITPLKILLLPVNKHGSQSRNLAIIAPKAYASERTILTFPAGLVSRKNKGEVRDLVWQPNFISKSIKYKRDIIPVYIDGKNSNFFYWLSNVRKKLRIPINLEMILLPHELFRQRKGAITFVIGSPIPYATFDASKTKAEWAEWVKDECYKLKEKIKN